MDKRYNQVVKTDSDQIAALLLEVLVCWKDSIDMTECARSARFAEEQQLKVCGKFAPEIVGDRKRYLSCIWAEIVLEVLLETEIPRGRGERTAAAGAV